MIEGIIQYGTVKNTFTIDARARPDIFSLISFQSLIMHVKYEMEEKGTKKESLHITEI